MWIIFRLARSNLWFFNVLLGHFLTWPWCPIWIIASLMFNFFQLQNVLPQNYVKYYNFSINLAWTMKCREAAWIIMETHGCVASMHTSLHRPPKLSRPPWDQYPVGWPLSFVYSNFSVGSKLVSVADVEWNAPKVIIRACQNPHAWTFQIIDTKTWVTLLKYFL